MIVSITNLIILAKANMFHPAAIIVNEDFFNFNMEEVLDSIHDSLSIFCISIIFLGLFKLVASINIYHIWSFFWSFFWNSLTPGQQWLEIGCLITSLAATASIIWFLEEVSTTIDKKIAQMKKDLEQKDERISQLETMMIKKEKEDLH
jgi:hypothetical protein